MALLAQKLNELAAANAEGLLNDDEYRLLRQDLFESYSGDNLLPIELPIVPAVGRIRKLQFSPPSPPELSPTTPVHRSKPSLVVTFIRKATGRKPPPPDPKDPPFHSPSSPPATFKRSFLPKVLSRKPSMDVSSLRSSSTATTRKDSLSLSSSHKASLSANGSDTFTSPPVSPTRRLASPSKLDLSSGPSDDIFEDGGLATTKEIRQAIIEIEIEGKKVIEAFDGLELKALARHREQASPRRPPLPPPLPSYLTASSASSSASSADRSLTRQRSGSDVVSLRSINSANGTGSLMPGPRSPTSPKSVSQSLKHKNSFSSISSQTASLRSTRLRAVHNPLLSRSTGHLPLNMLLENDNDDLDTELTEIRRKRLEVINRYDTRLEYLRARLKGAELHEKLLRK